jgi:hypothetical protein
MGVDEERRVTLLEDIESIRRLKGLYAMHFDDALNGGRPFPTEPVLDLFTKDAVWTSTPFGRFEGRDAIRGFFESYRRRVSFCLHYMINPVIDVAEDRLTATGRWHAWELMTLDGEAYILAGHYRDEYVRSDEQWLFKNVQLDVLYLTPWLRGWAKERIPADWKW